MKGKNRDMTNVGHFAVLLARCCYFGDDLQIPVTKAMDDRLHNGALSAGILLWVTTGGQNCGSTMAIK